MDEMAARPAAPAAQNYTVVISRGRDLVSKEQNHARTLYCLYCARPWTSGVVRKSKEHPLGQWRKRIETDLPAEQTIYEMSVDFDETTNELIEGQPQVRSKAASLLTLHTRDVCKDCNTGWMKNLQDAGKPILLQLERVAETRMSIVLSGANARTLAQWAQVAALSHELTSEGSRVGTTAMGKLLLAGIALPNSVVFLARLQRDYGMAVLRAQIDVSATPIPKSGPPDRRILMTAIASHRLCILVLISDSPGQVGPLLPCSQWAVLWPSYGSVAYPPTHCITDSELVQLMAQPGRWLPPVQVPIRSSSASVGS